MLISISFLSGYLLLVTIVNLAVGIIIGKEYSKYKSLEKIDKIEKQMYCDGFKDGVYYIAEEDAKQLMTPDIVEKFYAKYKSIKSGPNKH